VSLGIVVYLGMVCLLSPIYASLLMHITHDCINHSLLNVILYRTFVVSCALFYHYGGSISEPFGSLHKDYISLIALERQCFSYNIRIYGLKSIFFTP
jgi:hypothetical protein